MTKSKYKNQDLTNLIQLSQEGDNKALEELIRRLQKDIFVLFTYLTEKKQDISDLTQEVLLKIAHNINSLKNINNFKSWRNQIIINTFYNYLKKDLKNKEIEYNNDKLLEIKDKIGCEPGEKCLISEVDKFIKAALLNLPENLRIVIILREFEGLSYEEIAKLVNISLGTVKSRISRARNKLQEELKEFI